MKLYLSKVQEMQNSFKGLCIVKILRLENETQAVSAIDGEAEEDTPIEILSHSSITDMMLVSTIETILDWQKDIVGYLEKEVLPSKKKLAAQLRAKIYDGEWNSLQEGFHVTTPQMYFK
jgi:hypothetical protein